VSPQPLDSVKGFAVTFRQLFKKPITQQYPEYKRPVYPRFRGRHRLHLHDNGLEKCVGCSLCAAACPADCIRVVAEENTPENRVSPGERYARIYEINMSRCIFCGYCELDCPFDAITLFFGGWLFPWVESLDAYGPIWFFLKLFIFVSIFIWIRASQPRLRYDQLMRLGWKVLLPVATLNALVTAFFVVLVK
jgi:NADH-quinone oxidoreductase chain I